MTKKGLVPEIRFPEFKEDKPWKLESFSNVYELKTTNSFSRDKLNYNLGSVKNIHYGDIHTKFATLFDLDREHVPFVNTTETLEKIKTESYCQESDLVIADASEDLEDIGKSIELVNLKGEKVIAGLHTILARQKHGDLVTGFGGYLFKSSVIRKQIQREAQGAKVLGISAGRISKITIPYPHNKKEQQKIAGCLTSIDELISAQTKKIETIKASRKGLMQQLFPFEGESVPRLRFEEFSTSDSWKNRKFSTLFEIGGGRDHKHLSDGNNPVYGSGGYMRSVDSFLYDGESACIGRKGTINKPIYLEGKFWTVDTLFYTHSFKDCLPKFIYLLFQNINWLRFNEAGGVPSLSKVIINNIEVRVPSIEEQKRIVEAIWSIDILINEQTKRLDSLKIHKKGLLQKLFPSFKEEEGHD